MDIHVLNLNLECVDILDSYESFIWCDRYYGYGDFEIYTDMNVNILERIKEDYYLQINSSEHIMIVEDFKIKTDTENGNKLIVSGRSIESILDRRIIWNKIVINGNIQNGIHELLVQNVIDPILPDRKIDNFIFEYTDDEFISNTNIDIQLTWSNLYETIQKICMTYNIGFKIIVNSNNQFVFSLYNGTDRSYDQMDNPHVEFSPNFENLLNSNYEQTKKNLKTVTIVAGEGEDEERKTTVIGSGIGIDRRELYTDARDLSQTNDGVTMTDSEYLSKLTQRGIEDLNTYNFYRTFDAHADTYGMFRYNTDFYMGDVLQLVSEYNVTAKTRVTEMIFSDNSNGFNAYPKFSIDDASTYISSGVLMPGTVKESITAEEILTKLKTVDGSLSGLDSDMIDGHHYSELEPIQNIYSFTKSITISSANVWVDSGIMYNHLFTGTYVMEAYCATTSLGQWYMSYSGIINWYAQTTNDGTNTSEIQTVFSGHALANGIPLRFRIAMTAGAVSPNCHLEVTCGIPGTYAIDFKFKRLL